MKVFDPLKSLVCGVDITKDKSMTLFVTVVIQNLL
jgi:hypothetical protein